MTTPKPEILQWDNHGDSACIRMCFPADYRYFDGHFDQTPILPGVAQLDTAIRMAMQIFGRSAPAGMKAVKFKSIIRPDIHVELQLLQQGDTVTFQYRDATTAYGGGKILF